ncbi:MAG: hypothetical protein K6A73_08410 [Bacteroidales bacterium]|nr:hypothetical protein [Bacteroidales bacterium]
MGFFRNMFNEAGSKAGRAIGNKLFPKSTDYIRIGDLDGSSSERAREMIEVQSDAEQERIAAQLSADTMRMVLNLQFDVRNMDHNLNVLTQLATIIDSLPSWFNRTEEEKRIYKTAKAKMQAGLVICKSKDPNNPTLAYFEEKYG